MYGRETLFNRDEAEELVAFFQASNDPYTYKVKHDVEDRAGHSLIEIFDKDDNFIGYVGPPRKACYS